MAELLLALAVLLILVTTVTVILHKKTVPTHREPTTIAGELVSALGRFVEWRSEFIGDTPHVDDDRCPGAKVAADQVKTLLDEYAANPGKDANTLAQHSQEFEDLLSTARRWCPSTTFPAP